MGGLCLCTWVSELWNTLSWLRSWCPGSSSGLCNRCVLPTRWMCWSVWWEKAPSTRLVPSSSTFPGCGSLIRHPQRAQDPGRAMELTVTCRPIIPAMWKSQSKGEREGGHASKWLKCKFCGYGAVQQPEYWDLCFVCETWWGFGLLAAVFCCEW